jgi:hypothetical protein
LTGRVLDEHLTPLSGVKIQTGDSSNIAVTDEHGYYSIQIPQSTNRIHVWQIGMENETFKIRKYCIFNIVLMNMIIAEFETPKEHKSRLKGRKKKRPNIYREAINKDLITENKPCS